MQKNILTDLSVMKQKLDELGSYIVKEHLKRKIPLFVIGSGISMDLKIPDDLKGKASKIGIPAMNRIIETLYSLYERYKELIPEQDKEVLRKRFEMWEQQKDEYRKVDRSTVGGILGYFQEKGYFKEAWIEFNNWLLHKCVDEKIGIGIINAPFSIAHEKIAELYEKVDAFCLTTNFDGLFYKALQLKYGNKNAFSYYTKKDVERFFVDETCPSVNRAEIQVRGDIFFVKCDEICEIYKICDQRVTEPIRIWDLAPEPLKCSKEEYRKPFISFPGTYEKDKEIREILGVLWKFLSYRVSCIITIGIGGWWDPILVAFLSDLVRERDIPFIDVSPSSENSYIVKEIVKPDASDKRKAFNIPANQFMDILNQALENAQKLPTISIKYPREEVADDRFWTDILKDWNMNWGMSDFEKKLMEHPLVAITSKFAQLGLKSKWLGISDRIRWQHNRLNHSKGVMKIATYLYEKACRNSGRPEKEEEKQFLRIAALLHDIGHLPFSHLIEEVFQELNWKPIGYTESFSHDYYTGEKVRRIFEDDGLKKSLKKSLEDIGYSVEDLIKLINGEFGVGFLDAIINGPIDADKIDYVYRDAELTQVFPHLMEPEKFLEEIGKDITINHAELLMLKENSARAAFTILQQRERLYKQFYLDPDIRLLEKAVKFILTTYFVYKYNIPPNEIPKKIKNKFLSDEKQFSDLGAIKIAMASEELEELAVTYKAANDIEMEMVCYMKENLDSKPLDAKVKSALDECFRLIKDVGQTISYKDAGQKFRYKDKDVDERLSFSPARIEEIRYHAKTVVLRFPGALLIDVLPPFEFFKIAGARKRRLRSDGTDVESTCILSPNLLQMVKEKPGSREEQAKAYVYKIGEESDVNMAVGLFKRLCAEGKRLEEVE